MAQILIVEDETIIRTSLRKLLERHGHEVREAGSVQEARAHEPTECDLVISDVRLPGEPGTEMIAIARPTPVLIMTTFSSVRSAVDAMRMGAVDYITKPFDQDEMIISVERILKERTLLRQNQALKIEIERSKPLSMVGESPAMQDLLKKIRKVAPTISTVLILGESGTGKELVARQLHELSDRASGPLVPVNCAAIPETLIESELFGYEKGAFTGAQTNRKGLVEAADGGTLFLDEIGELPLEAQARLLRMMQEKEVRRIGATASRKVDVRVVAATHRNLKQLASEGHFREDLYYRLNVFELRLPPLRERGDDIVRIAHHLLERTCQKLNRPALDFSQQALSAIKKYSWPGNVREMENIIERAIILCDDEEITPDLLTIEVHGNDDLDTDKNPDREKPEDATTMNDYLVRFVLEHQDHMTETKLAEALGISRKNLWERRKSLNILRKSG